MRRLIVVVIVLAAVCVRGWAQDEKGLVAHWDFHEGTGEVLHDRSGNGNDGTIHGATWVKSGAGYALKFDGVDDYVDCGAGPSLDIRDKITLAAWVWAADREHRGEAGIVGKAYESYVLTCPYYHRRDSRIYAYCSGGGHNTYATLTPGQWHHVASTYDGMALRLYIDGRQVSAKGLKLPAINSRGHFWMGRSDGAVQWTKDAHFQGKITEVRVYDDALTPDEIADLARTTNITHTVNLSVLPLAWRGMLLVDVNTLGLGADHSGIVVDLAILRRSSGGGKAQGQEPVLAQSVSRFDAPGVTAVKLDACNLAVGEYELDARTRTSQGKAVGHANRVAFKWKGVPRFPRGPEGTRRLNNLVTELLNIPGPDTSGREYRFVNPRGGWIFISNAGADKIVLRGENQDQPMEVALADEYNGAHEAMRHLAPGAYTITAASAKRLIVRAIPQLTYAAYGANPQFAEYGPFDVDEFQRKHILRNVNACSGWQRDWTTKPFVDPWIKRGKRWFCNCPVPKGTPEEPLTEEAVYEVITANPHWLNPKVSGFFADEFGHSEPYCTVWAKVVDRVLSDPKSKGKSFNPYANDLWQGKDGRELVSVIVKHNSTLLWKRYLKEQRSESAAWRHLLEELVHIATQWRENCPGVMPHITVAVGYFCKPPISLDTFPHVDYKTHLDMQYHLIATHPAFEGIAGLQSYTASYSDEETVRWGARLFRHYGIEGRTAPLGTDPYILPYLRNGDFEMDGEGWELSPAEGDAPPGKGSIRLDASAAFGWLQGRFPEHAEGDTVIVTRRCANKPNVFSQKIRNLEPGRLYSFRMFSGEFDNLFEKARHAVSVRIANATILQDNAFTHVFPNLYAKYYGKYKDAEHCAWMNYHWRVFRAKASTARLTITDWASEQNPGGKIGQELMFNFVQVQPYLEE